MGTSTGNESRFTFWVAVCFTVNIIMGTGFLTLPWAFYKTGIVLSILLMALIGVISMLATCYFLESMSRYLTLTGGYESFFGVDTMGLKEDVEYEDLEQHQEERRMLTFGASNGEKVKTDDDLLKQIKKVHDENTDDNVVDITDMCEYFLGGIGRNVYLTVITVNIYSTLTCFCSVFATSFAYQMPIYRRHDHNYNLWLAIFFVVTVPASCIELNEQIDYQLFLSFCRVLLVAIMLISVFLAIYCHSPIDSPVEQDAYEGFSFTSFPQAPYGAPMWDMRGALTLLPLGTASNIFQYCIPSLSQPVEDKKSLAYIFGYTIFGIFVLYCSIGACLAYYFGAEMPPSANTAWSSFHGSARGLNSWMANFLSTYVVLFPALDVSSAFPLNAISLGHSMYTSLQEHPSVKQFCKENDDVQCKVGSMKDDISSNGHSGDINKMKWGYTFTQLEMKIIFRLLAACPPFIFAIILSDLEKIFTYAGINAFIVGIVFPPLLAYTSKQKMISSGLSPKTMFSSKYYSNDVVMITMLIIGICFFIFVTFEVVKKDFSGHMAEKEHRLHQREYYHAIGSVALRNVTNIASNASMHSYHYHNNN